MSRVHLLFVLPTVLTIIFLCSPVQAVQSDIYLKNTAAYDSGRYLWTVYVAGEASLINNISSVEYTLHYSFPKPVQQVHERGSKCAFALSSNSWGEFEVKAKIVFKTGEIRYVKYWLDLLKNKTSTAVCSAAKSPKRTRRR